MPSAQKALESLFAADRALRSSERAFLESAPPDELIRVLSGATAAALKSDAEGSTLELTRLADLAAQVEGRGAAAILLDILDHEDPAVRAEAGDALLDVAYERFKDVAQAIEKALDEKREGLGMEELPYVLIEVHEPDPLPLLLRFLSHPRGEVVASAIEAIVESGNAQAVPQLRKLRSDTREVTLAELEDEKVTVGDLATEALDFFAEAMGEPEEEPAAKPASAPRGGRRR